MKDESTSLTSDSFVKGVISGEIDVVRHVERILTEAVVVDDEFHFFNAFAKDAVNKAMTVRKALTSSMSDSKTNLPLAGVPISVKDNICVHDVETTAGSKILKGYLPVFNSTAVQRLIDAGAIIIGKTAQDEFGFGSFSRNVGVGFETPLNPVDKERTCGGSSGGAAGWTKKTMHTHVALAESTGGSIVCPASFCGVVGLCPTYGLVSRWGLLDYASSLDKIGPIARSILDAAQVLEVIAGPDAKDSTCVGKAGQNVTGSYSDAAQEQDISGLRVGLVEEALGEGVTEAVRSATLDAAKKLESGGASLSQVSLPITMQAGLSAYYVLAMAEASTNLARYCGMRYGARAELRGSFDDYFGKIRAENLGAEAKRRIVLGTFTRSAGYRDAYYVKAAKVRTLILQEYARVFKKVDVLLTPTMPFVAPRFCELDGLTPLQNYVADILTVGPNLAGVPHISVPFGSSYGMPIGVMLTGTHFAEEKIIRAGGCLER